MKFDLKKWTAVGIRFVPYLSEIVSTVEAIKTAKGAEKLAAAKAAIAVGLESTEFALDRDLLNDAKVVEAQDRLIEAIVSFQNAVAAAKAAQQALKDAPVQ